MAKTNALIFPVPDLLDPRRNCFLVWTSTHQGIAEKRMARPAAPVNLIGIAKTELGAKFLAAKYGQITVSGPDFQNRSCQSKKRYLSENDAMIAAYIQMGLREESTLRAYACNLCGGWHLTKAPRVYVDPSADHAVQARGLRRMSCCHLFTDGALTGLHKFALVLDLKLEWFQETPYPHYDLIGRGVRLRAVKRGAIEVGRTEAIRIMRAASLKESTQH